MIIIDIYGSAREAHGGVHSRDLVRAIEQENDRNKKQQEIRYIPTLAECEQYLRENSSRGDIIALMGAGDIFRVGENLIKK